MSFISTFKKKLRIRRGFLTFIILLVFSIWIICAQPIFFNPSVLKLAHWASSENLQTHVKKISEDFFPRDSENTENLNRTAEYIKTQIKQFSREVSEQKFTVKGKEYKNIIARFGALGKPVLVIGAHYDSCEELPAADDNASGVAGLIELARLLTLEYPTNFEVQLVAYSTEEPPFFGSNDMGSYIHAESLSRENKPVIGMLSLEMIGYFSNAWGSQSLPSYLMRLFYPSKGNFIAVVSDFSSYAFTKDVKQGMQRNSELSVYSMNGPPSFYGIDYSDHRNYWKFGYPSVMITDTAFLRNKAYHTIGDTFDKLDYRKMAEVVTSVHQFVIKKNLELEKVSN
ncbi:peptidase M28 [Bdellovibrio sp. qaytius]|nr:peptidase M28 [Bdellovibrio sp. qaytius]